MTMNKMIMVKIEKVTFEEWKKAYDGDSELRKEFMDSDVVGKIDDHNAMIVANITDEEKIQKGYGRANS